ncbi:MAG: hypothetical protein SFY95_00760 [Planctomycetota bacterium]|nr:hypothetical protein [Planctomycetota bacterium]
MARKPISTTNAHTSQTPDNKPGPDEAAQAEQAATADLVGTMPRSADELAEACRRLLDLRPAREAVIAGHRTQLDYLWWAFDESRPLALGADAVVWANRGGGKTLMGAVATTLDMIYKPGVSVRILAGSVEQASRMLDHLRRFFERDALRPLVKGRPTARTLELRNGSNCEVLSPTQESVRGTRVQKLRCDEVELFDEELWNAAQLTTCSKEIEVDGQKMLVRGRVEALSTMHRPSGLMDRLVHQRAGAREVFRWGVLDVLNHCGDEHVCERCTLAPDCQGRAKRRPANGDGSVHLGHVLVSDARDSLARVGRAEWECEMLSLRPRRTDAVLPEFDERVHVIDELPWRAGDGHVSFIAGMDFGIRAPAAVLIAGVEPSGRIVVCDERVRAGEALEEHARWIVREPVAEITPDLALPDEPPAMPASVEWPWPTPEWIGVDPAGLARNEQTGISDAAALRKFGLVVRARSQRTEAGLRALRRRLKSADGSAPGLVIHRRCASLIASLRNYRYGPGESLEPLKDGNDHAVDALRYMVQNVRES